MRYDPMQSRPSSSTAEPARCGDCRQLAGHRPTCTVPLEVARIHGDSEEERRLAIALERANAGAAEWLLLRGIDPHTYRAGAGR